MLSKKNEHANHILSADATKQVHFVTSKNLAVHSFSADEWKMHT